MLTTFTPLIWVINNSFKSTDEILKNPVTLPEHFNLANYIHVSNYGDFSIFRGFMNSLIISGTVVLSVLLFGGLASFVIARFKFKFSETIKMFFVVSILVPNFSVIIPGLLIMRHLKLNGTYWSLIIPQISGFLPFTILMLVGFMITIPAELEEAAIIDGCSIPRIFFKITVPLSVPAFMTTAIMIFLWSYNDLFMSLIYISNRLYQPICVLLSLVSSIFGVNYGAMMAALTITIMPVLILYIISQEYVIKGLTAGAVKG